MAFAKIRCGNCRRKWIVYWRDVKAPNSNRCPFCGEEIDRTLWNRDVVNALAAIEDTNMELQKDASGYGKTRFSIDLLAG